MLKFFKLINLDITHALSNYTINNEFLEANYTSELFLHEKCIIVCFFLLFSPQKIESINSMS